jgi:hypothetical protein
VKLRKLGITGLITLFTFASAVLAADEQAVKFGISLDYYSKYIWRGQVLSNKSVFEPAISANAYGFTGSVWGNMNLSNSDKIVPDNAGEFSEYDWTLDYTNALPGVEGINYSVGVIYYRFPNQIFKPTTEIYGGLTLSNVPLTPSFKVYRDVDEADGSYLQLSVGHLFEKIYVADEKCYCGLQLGASIAWANKAYDDFYFGEDSGQFNDLTLSAGLPVCVGYWTIRPSINYATMLADSIREVTYKSDNVWWGVGLSTSF